MTKEIQLSNGGVALVDDEDFEEMNKIRWFHFQTNGNTYAITKLQDKQTKQRKTKYMHRLVLGAPSHMQVDHINHNGLDNRKSNLRLCTNKENQRNRRVQKNNKLGVSGVWRSGNKYGVSISVDGNRKHIGLFDTLEQATQSRKEAESKYWKR